MTLFLDIDGVLNGHKAHANSFCGIDPGCRDRMNAIFDEFDPDVVIHSAWRYLVLNGSMTIDGFAHMLATHGLKVYRPGTLKHRIMDVTRMDMDKGSECDRADQIREHAKGIEGPWIAVDDLKLPLAAKRFLHTPSNCGLDQPAYEKLRRMIAATKTEE